MCVQKYLTFVSIRSFVSAAEVR